MRSKEEILKKPNYVVQRQQLSLELLADIRDLLVEIRDRLDKKPAKEGNLRQG